MKKLSKKNVMRLAREVELVIVHHLIKGEASTPAIIAADIVGLVISVFENNRKLTLRKLSEKRICELMHGKPAVKGVSTTPDYFGGNAQQEGPPAIIAGFLTAMIDDIKKKEKENKSNLFGGFPSSPSNN